MQTISINSLDFLSPRITWYHNKKHRHSSILSGVLSIFTVLLGITLFVISCEEYFNHRRPTSYFYNKFVNESGIYPLNSEQLYHYVTMQNGIIDPQILSIIGINLNIIEFSPDPRPETISHWIYSPCTTINAYPDLPEIYERDFNTSYCINKYYNNTTQEIIDISDSEFSYPYISKDFKNEHLVKYGIIIQKCKNSTILNNKSCKSDSEINQYFAIHYGVELKFIENEFDITNFRKPIIPRIYSITNGIFSNTYTVNHLNFKPASVISHTGIIFDSTSEWLTYTFEQNEKITYDTVPGEDIICGFYFWIHNYFQIYERSYKRLKEILGTFGGALDWILTVSSTVNYWYAEFIALNNVSIILSKIEWKNKSRGCSTININNSLSNFIKSHNQISHINASENKLNINETHSNTNNNNMDWSRSNQNIFPRNTMIKYINFHQIRTLRTGKVKCKNSTFNCNINNKNGATNERRDSIDKLFSERTWIYKLPLKTYDHWITFINFIKWIMRYKITIKNSQSNKIAILNNYYKSVLSVEEWFCWKYDLFKLQCEVLSTRTKEKWDKSSW